MLLLFLLLCGLARLVILLVVVMDAVGLYTKIVFHCSDQGSFVCNVKYFLVRNDSFTNIIVLHCK